METKLSEFVERMKAAALRNLTAVVLYGSAVGGEFHAKHSDLNILCLVERAGVPELERIHSVAEWWVKGGNPVPLIFTLDELHRSADVFAIELFDMKIRHRMLHGTDFLEGFEVPMRLHRLQVERELRSGWVRLRQAVLMTKQDAKTQLGVMLASHSTFATLFRHAVIALGGVPPAGKREALAALAEITGANPSAFQAILDLRQGKRKEKEIDVETTLAGYVDFVEVVTNEVDRRLEVS
jgi:hypothetical protein